MMVRLKQSYWQAACGCSYDEKRVAATNELIEYIHKPCCNHTTMVCGRKNCVICYEKLKAKG